MHVQLPIKVWFCFLLDVGITVRFVLNVCKVVTFVLINVFLCGKKEVVGIGE